MTKKHYFVLRNIDPVEIDRKYSFYVPISFNPLDLPRSKAPQNEGQRTKITELTYKQKERNVFCFLDESKKEHACVLTMVSRDDFCELPDTTGIHCFWCRHPFETRPLGCPIQYVPKRVVKNYYSEITKDNYTLRENISNRQLQENHDFYKQISMDLHDRDFYITDGVFCSFNCCAAFIHDNRSVPMYNYSDNLLRHLYVQIFGAQIQPIAPAASWRMLKAYGGELSIEEFRRNFYKVDYKDVDNPIIPSLKFKTIGFLFEKQVRI